MPVPEAYMDLLLSYGERIFFALVILIAGRIAIKTVKKTLGKVSDRKQPEKQEN